MGGLAALRGLSPPYSDHSISETASLRGWRKQSKRREHFDGMRPQEPRDNLKYNRIDYHSIHRSCPKAGVSLYSPA